MNDFLMSFLNQLTVAALAALPIVEFKGAVLYGLYLGMCKPVIGLCGLIGCALNAYIFIILFEPTYRLAKNQRLFAPTVHLARRKILPHKAKLEAKLSQSQGFRRSLLSLWSVFLLVSLPLPGMGALTGTAVGTMLKMKRTHLFWAVFLGNSVVGLVMLIFSKAFI